MLGLTKTKALETTIVTTQDFITELFCRVDDAMTEVSKHSQATLYPSQVVTLAVLFAVKGVGNRPFYRWLERDFTHLFPGLAGAHASVSFVCHTQSLGRPLSGTTNYCWRH